MIQVHLHDRPRLDHDRRGMQSPIVPAHQNPFGDDHFLSPTRPRAR